MVFVGKTTNCCVVTCKNHSGLNSGVTYHKFPFDPDVEEQWIGATGRKDWSPQKNSTICSQHFTEDDFIIEGTTRKLIDSAVPTLNIPVENPQEQMSRPVAASVSNKYITNQRLHTKFDHIQKLLKNQKQTIKKLREQLRRDSKKIELQNKVLSDLMEIYDLKQSDIAILRTEILKLEKPTSSNAES